MICCERGTKAKCGSFVFGRLSHALINNPYDINEFLGTSYTTHFVTEDTVKYTNTPEDLGTTANLNTTVEH